MKQAATAMFRASKKRSKPAAPRVRLLDQEEEDEEEQQQQQQQQVNLMDRKKGKKSLQQKANRTAARYFHEPDEALVEEDSTSSNKRGNKKHKSGVLGFGGFAATDPDDDDGDDEVATAYDRVALSKLRAEQKSYVKQLKKDEPPNISELGHAQTMLPSREEDRGKDRPALPDYLPLNNRSQQMDSSATILTGDEALSYAEQQQQQGHLDDDDDAILEWSGYGKPSALESQVRSELWEEDTADDWEAEVTRRAGIFPSNSNAKVTAISASLRVERAEDTNELASSGSSSSGKPLALLHQLRTQILTTIEQLNGQHRDMERGIERRKGEIEINEATVQRQEKELKEAGSALELYQKWRNDLILWVGAMREFRSKVEPILVALHELEGEKSAVQRWYDWEDDTIAVLQEHGLLKQVIGRQPLPTALPVMETTVDEFGRDVKSQYMMQREKRTNHRRRIRQQRLSGLRVTNGCLVDDHDSNVRTVVIPNSVLIRGDESDAFVSDGEEEAFRERRKALLKALSIAMDDLQEEYTLVHNLVDLFEEWHSAYPEDYKQCFASLSLADLAGILVQAELCALNDPWDESGGYNEAKWTSVVHSAMGKGTLDQAAVERLLQKFVFPAISDLLAKTGINLTSSRQTRSLGKFISHIQKLLPVESPVWRTLRTLLTAFAAQSLADIAIPIVSKAAHSPRRRKEQEVTANGQEDLDEALYAATWGQLYRIKKTLENLILYWAPVMQSDPEFCDLVLHFVSNKFLFLLSSLQGRVQDGLAETPAEVFREVFQSLSQTGWLDNPEYMLQAAPIRAAAAAYNAI